MLKLIISILILISIAGKARADTKLNSVVIIQSLTGDESITISLNEPVYSPGDTVRLSIIRNDGVDLDSITPILAIEGTALESVGGNAYIAVIPQNTPHGSYPVHLRVPDANGRTVLVDTNCRVEVVEYQDVERIGRYASITPEEGSEDPKTAVTLTRGQIRNLQVVFQRDSIQENMGPQFLAIRTTVISRKDDILQTTERRIMTFRRENDAAMDRAKFMRYKLAYGSYALIRKAEIERVNIPLDSLPNWAIIKIRIEPDYAINIGAAIESNTVTRYFRVKGPTIEMGFTLGVPKVLYDTQARDSMEYGNSSALFRFYYVSARTGHRFPVSIGVGTFGVNTPIDVGSGRGGFAVSAFLDVIELMKKLDMDLGIKVNAGIEFTPFFPINRRSRLLFDAHVGYAL